eukprot:TRINITY_DN54986_c0_g1_i2.p1 TRINITY_DN54986_c0_g1~~TRINITY_DN54986_c0_g1_i2.p1  ORF type:complete len:152 (+),score=45.93 TRINITY_DN54986_c0_g1_i2:91-546(+)
MCIRDRACTHKLSHAGVDVFPQEATQLPREKVTNSKSDRRELLPLFDTQLKVSQLELEAFAPVPLSMVLSYDTAYELVPQETEPLDSLPFRIHGHPDGQSNFAQKMLERMEQDCTDAHAQWPVSYTHLRAHETPEHLVCRLLLEKKKNSTN